VRERSSHNNSQIEIKLASKAQDSVCRWDLSFHSLTPLRINLISLGTNPGPHVWVDSLTNSKRRIHGFSSHSIGPNSIKNANGDPPPRTEKEKEKLTLPLLRTLDTEQCICVPPTLEPKPFILIHIQQMFLLQSTQKTLFLALPSLSL
jgi:hypothetical protein